MDHLDPLIASLNDDEKNSFAAFLDKSQRENKEVKLFALLTDGVERTPKEIVRKLYGNGATAGNGAMNAYHSLRKRLMARIFSFVMSRVMTADHADHTQIPGTIEVCKVFIHRERMPLAKHFLQKAEKNAILYRQYDMLDQLYNFYIEYAQTLELDLQDVIAKSIQNGRKIETQRKLNFAVAMLRNKLRDVRKQGDTLNPESVTSLILEELKIDVGETRDPLFQFKILSLYRTALISIKEYYDLEGYILDMYNGLLRENAFTRADQQTEQGFLFYLAHAQYRNRKFVSAMATLEKAESIMPNELFRASPYYLKMIALKAAIQANSGNNHLALELMHKHMHQIRRLTDSGEQLNMMLNYCVYHFNAGDFKSASALMRETEALLRSSKKDMGMEWIFKKRMIHMIIRIELESLDEAEKLHKSIKEDYKDFFQNPVYKRAGIFLGLIEEYLRDPIQVSDPEFIHKVRNSGLAWPGHKEDIQAITFFCWLLSKMMRKPYYEVLMERMREGVISL
jgi:hypothetical protein